MEKVNIHHKRTSDFTHISSSKLCELYYGIHDWIYEQKRLLMKNASFAPNETHFDFVTLKGQKITRSNRVKTKRLTPFNFYIKFVLFGDVSDKGKTITPEWNFKKPISKIHTCIWQWNPVKFSHQQATKILPYQRVAILKGFFK